jgi:hypothetical protein
MGSNTHQNIVPKFLILPVSALSISGILKSGPPLIPVDALHRYGVLDSPKRVDSERVLWGFHIQSLPNQLESSDLLGQNSVERVSEILRTQSGLLMDLCKWQGAGFSLRYIFRPESRRVEVVLLSGVTGKPGTGVSFANRMASDVFVHLQNQKLEYEYISTYEDLEQFLNPIPDPYIVEIWQKEIWAELTFERSFGLETEPAVVICPFRRPKSSTWLAFFNKLVQQEHPVVLNIHVEPTTLYQREAQVLAENARVARSAATYTLKRNTYHQQVTDPVAEAVARLYDNTWQRLVNGSPVLMTVQVASKDPVTAFSVAQSFAVQITEDCSFDSVVRNENELAAGYDIVAPDDESDLQAAQQTLKTIDLHPWISSGIDLRGRLIYLTDARTASAAFRFPVAQRGGVPGLRTHIVRPNYYVISDEKGNDTEKLLVGTLSRQVGNAEIRKSNLIKHMLVAGTTGSGKTNTCMSLLIQLWEQKLPFLVIEPATVQYRSLIQSPIGKDLRIFTLGDESTSPFRLNPLEILPGVTVETHISQIQVCLESAVPSFGALPSLIG